MTRALPLPELGSPLEEIDRGERRRLVVSEAYGSSAALFLLAAVPRLRSPLLVVTPRAADSKDLELDLGALDRQCEVVRLAEREDHEPRSPEAKHNRALRERALAAMHEQQPGTVFVASLAALADRTGDPALHREGPARTLRVGDRVDRDELRRTLYALGYDPAPLVSHPGESSLRGDILDFYPFTATAPLRLELFDDEIESLREFDPESQRSTRSLGQILLPAASERPRVRQADQAFSALDHFAAEPLVVRLDPVQMGFAAEQMFEREGGRPELAALLRRLEELRSIELHPEYRADAEIVVGARAPQCAKELADLGPWGESLAPELRTLHVFSATASEGKRLTALLREHLPARPRRGVVDHRGSLARGFQCAALGIWVGNHHEVLSRTRLRRVEGGEAVPTRPIKEVLELSPGDHVVHFTHGVGLYRGTKEHQNEGGTEDYLIVEYEGGTLLYVPASKVELLTRYIGAGGEPPKLDRIGGRSWSRKKAQVEAALDGIATELLEMQARRQTRPGFAFTPDDDMQAEFEAAFPYQETEDQVTSLEEIKADMQSARAMDRLLCGDVGFGKTELAVRAAFKAASQGKQVAVLAPTTLLVRQHEETFRDRMADYPLRVESLSRFTPSAKATEVLAGLAGGKIDIVVGTHRLLSGKVRFHDLGLLVIDEEQRFGVRHKEALKRLRSEVDVLTLSATPIPRTMHMAMVGLRDISTLRQAPRGRQPIDTVVTYYGDHLVRTALQRELAREGQVFYLYNRVQGIEAVAQRVANLVPGAKVTVAHGQMSGTQLERAALAFRNGKVDVLVCTSIIESGIDIPRVNTLIVEHSELLGLADLHQLRGRIGRSERKAYAYFLIPHKPLPAAALKRLRALEGLTHLGAGFDVAIRDLEIRGAGNLLGSQQSGHIAAIGYDLYCRLLAKVVARRSGRKPPPEVEEIDVNLGLPAFLPREYIHSAHQRMGMMRRLGEARGSDELEELARELRDRYGRPPTPVQNLIRLFQLKNACRLYGVARVFYPRTAEILLNVRDLRKFARAPLRGGQARYVEGSRVVLAVPPRRSAPEEVLEFLLEQFDPGLKDPLASVTGEPAE